MEMSTGWSDCAATVSSGGGGGESGVVCALFLFLDALQPHTQKSKVSPVMSFQTHRGVIFPFLLWTMANCAPFPISVAQFSDFFFMTSFRSFSHKPNQGKIRILNPQASQLRPSFALTRRV
jgi:hypothetical protein